MAWGHLIGLRAPTLLSKGVHGFPPLFVGCRAEGSRAPFMVFRALGIGLLVGFAWGFQASQG